MEIWTENFEQCWGMGLGFWNMEPGFLDSKMGNKIIKKIV